MPPVTLLLVGAITFYAGQYVGEPLRCGGVYDDSHTWLAVDMDALGPEWRCNDLARVTVGDDTMTLPILDSGYLSRYCVHYGSTCLPIVGDLPRHAFPWPGLSVQGTVENLTGGLRARMEAER